MKLDLFSVPIWMGNIDSDKINLIEQDLKPSFGSEIKTTYYESHKSNIQPESLEYLYQVIINLLGETVKIPFQLRLINIWKNVYEDKDFQETHIHCGSDLSFVIYQDVIQSNTEFMNPAHKLISAFFVKHQRKKDILGHETFAPECRKNQIIIFPSYLEHFVRKTSNAVTVSGNLELIIG
jgi:hypothetical protein